MKEGGLLKQIEIVKKLLEINMPISQISQVTNLNEKEIKKIQDKK